MAYRFYTSSDFDKQFRKLDSSVQRIIHKWIMTHLIDTDDPRSFGKPLIGSLKGYWHYSIGSWRLLVKIDDDELILIAVDIDHRSTVYR